MVNKCDMVLPRDQSRHTEKKSDVSDVVSTLHIQQFTRTESGNVRLWQPGGLTRDVMISHALFVSFFYRLK